MKNPKHIENPSLDRFLSSLIAMFWIGRLHSWIFRFHNHDSRTPYAKIISIYDRFTGENLCAKVITKKFCNPSGILVLDPDLLTSIRHKNIIEYREIYESDEEIIVTIERYCFKSEFIFRARGGELLDRIVAKNAYNEIDASRIVKQILEAVAYLHSKRIVSFFAFCYH